MWLTDRTTRECFKCKLPCLPALTWLVAKVGLLALSRLACLRLHYLPPLIRLTYTYLTCLRLLDPLTSSI